MSQRLIAILVILVAFGLRAYNLDGVPPGLTHDEANHGREGISILDGDLRLYYPLNYGSEPLYSYLVAGSMGVLGENIFALRFVGVIFGTLLIAALYLLGSKLFGSHVALLTAGFTATAYWPLVASRMALRATLFPLFMTMAVYAVWRLYQRQIAELDQVERGSATSLTGWIALFILGLTGTWYTYLAARLTWLLFPIFWGYLWLFYRKRAIPLGRSILIGFVCSAVLIAPMFVYLFLFPESSSRLGMLDGPLQSLLQGNVGPLLGNTLGGMLALFWPGQGDTFLAYNIPGRPVLNGILAFFFLAGLGITVFRWQKPAYVLLLLWVGIGLLPSLITGPTANTTRNIAVLPALYLCAAVGGVTLWRWIIRLISLPSNGFGRWAGGAAVLLTLVLTVRDYFWVWPNLPDVRGAYQTTLIASLDEIERALPSETPVMLSTVYPSAPHDPSIALVELDAKERPVAWMDSRLALLLPAKGLEEGGSVELFVPFSTPLHPAFQAWVEPVTEFETRPDDLDPGFIRYSLTINSLDVFGSLKQEADPVAIQFNEALTLLDSAWLGEPPTAGGVSELRTIWRIEDPERVGPIVWPTETTDIVLFAQLLRPDGTVLAQSDRLDAPSWNWREGDILVQIHPIFLPSEIEAGQYETILGVYDRQSGVRLTRDDNQADFAAGPRLRVN